MRPECLASKHYPNWLSGPVVIGPPHNELDWEAFKSAHETSGPCNCDWKPRHVIYGNLEIVGKIRFSDPNRKGLEGPWMGWEDLGPVSEQESEPSFPKLPRFGQDSGSDGVRTPEFQARDIGPSYRKLNSRPDMAFLVLDPEATEDPVLAWSSDRSLLGTEYSLGPSGLVLEDPDPSLLSLRGYLSVKGPEGSGTCRLSLRLDPQEDGPEPLVMTAALSRTGLCSGSRALEAFSVNYPFEKPRGRWTLRLQADKVYWTELRPCVPCPGHEGSLTLTREARLD